MQSLSLPLCLELIKKHGIKTARHYEIRDEPHLISACKVLGFPVALKIISKEISHKTEVGAVITAIDSIEEAKSAFRKMKRLEGFEGAIVQQMHSGIEIIIGAKRDPQFGPTVLIGTGGIYVEILKDFVIGICPITKKDAHKMVQKLKSYNILAGARGKKGANISKIEDTLLKVSELIIKENGISELDINPLIANEHEVIAVDCRVILQREH
ncbi:MAG TPA: acetate--CoA ligase family protein [archaeon]|nr:acetate--CoA ligase family protein [archaeon]